MIKRPHNVFIIIGIGAILMYSLLSLNDLSVWKTVDMWVFIGMGIVSLIGGIIGKIIYKNKKKK